MSQSSAPADRAALLARLAELDIETRTTDHPPLYTVEQSQALRGTIPGAHSKNLFLKDRKDALFLVVALEDATIDLKRIHERIGASGKVSFGKPELLMEMLGVVPGSVTPFGAVNDQGARVKVVLDAALMLEPVLNFHPLENTATTTIAREGLVRFLEAVGHPPAILAVSEEAIATGL
ncbi:prolyl-tRNA synthetase associated domain-containing protein [Segnochrobactrum spirostomi]|uniref:Prolyl-tRNA synthetase associated domain-containing protein n=1 Tax=Segnochrobactrum spirostomi TaxID=2608987 RepID=A0A6A7Y511_9HYPH|nr:YbaK/EbsC family protein [Segnochrobactrum spirostomi]MQT12812.1 prolyl-tRNA synthetase associated domain-containing protein [Segnochrobactrum spirostomi]